MTSIRLKNTKIARAQSPTSRDRSDRRRRIVNVAVASMGLLVAMPVMLIAAILVWITSRGPVIYRQTRVGVDRRGFGEDPGNSRRNHDVGGRPFTIYKFRTMTVGQGDDQVWASPDDPRITRVGRILRMYRIDELPQLVNVLRGDMNLVGPRPEQPAIFERLRHRIYRYAARQQVLPGITGWAQVNQQYDRCEEDVERKVAFDLEYLDKRSSLEDIKIMAKTVPVMAFKKGAW